MKNEIVEFRKALEIFDAKNTDRLVKDFEKMVTERIAPYSMWALKGHGAFKECYDVGETNFVIKFAAKSNNTESEKAIPRIASSEGFADLFPRTIYIPLSVDLPVSVIEDNGSYEYRYTYHTYRRIPASEREYFNYVIIQNKVAETAEDHPNNKDIEWSAIEYDKNPIIVDGEIIPYNLVWNSGIDSRTWIIDVIKSKGFGYFVELASFIRYNNIDDLHSRNIGYGINGEPLIFDWLS